jgi:hypothetical protein
MLYRRKHRLQAKAFSCWKTYILGTQNCKTKMMDLLELMNRRYLSQAFAGFVSAVERRKAAERKLCIIAQRQNVRFAFSVWSDWAASKAKDRALLQRASQRLNNLKMEQVRFS